MKFANKKPAYKTKLEALRKRQAERKAKDLEVQNRLTSRSASKLAKQSSGPPDVGAIYSSIPSVPTMGPATSPSAPDYYDSSKPRQIDRGFGNGGGGGGYPKGEIPPGAHTVIDEGTGSGGYSKVIDGQTVITRPGGMKKGGEVKESAMMKKEGRGMAKANMQKIASKAVKSHEKRMHKMSSGGFAAGHKKADGIAQRGKTRCKIS